MKRIFALIFIAVMLCSLTACAESIPDGTDTPVRTGQENIQYAGCGPAPPSLEEGGLEYTPVVADLTISGWLGEEGDTVSYFTADVNEVIAGEINQKRIVVSQAGSSTTSFDGSPLLTRGNRIMAFMIIIPEDYVESLAQVYIDEGKEVPEWLSHGEIYDVWRTAICDIAEVDGELYVMNRYSALTEAARNSKELVAMDKDIRSAAKDAVVEIDPLLDRYGYGAVFAYDDFTALVKKYAP